MPVARTTNTSAVPACFSQRHAGRCRVETDLIHRARRPLVFRRTRPDTYSPAAEISHLGPRRSSSRTRGAGAGKARTTMEQSPAIWTQGSKTRSFLSDDLLTCPLGAGPPLLVGPGLMLGVLMSQ